MPADERAPAPQEALRGILLDALLHDTTLAVAVSDAEGTVTLMSPALEALVENDFAPVPAESIATHFQVRTEDGSRLLTPAEEPLNRARLGASFHDQVVSVEFGGERRVHLRCSGAPLLADDGSVQGGIVIFTDITAQRALEREQAELRERLIDTVNHELRTPLTALLGHAELLEDLGPQLPEWAARSLRAVLDAGERMRDLVGSVSDLVDLEAAGHVTLASEDLTDVVRQCLDRVRQTLERSDVTVELHAPGESLDADIDGALLCRALTALLANAVQHSPPDATVCIDVVGTAAVVSVQVSDHGPGIAAAERARLVRPFERGSSDLTGPRGRGLGLPLAHAVALAHHGTLALRDNEPHGLVAVLMLPRRRPMSRG